MGYRPALITGANAKIKMGGKVIGYAVNVSYAVTVDTIPVEVMGRYEVVNHEPVGYYVGGGLQVIRYNPNAATSELHNESLPNSNAEGNSVETWAPGHFNPAHIINSESLNLEIFQKLGTGSVGTSETSEFQTIKITGVRLTSRGGGLSKRGYLVENYDWVGVLAQDDGKTNIARTANTGNDLA